MDSIFDTIIIATPPLLTGSLALIMFMFVSNPAYGFVFIIVYILTVKAIIDQAYWVEEFEIRIRNDGGEITARIYIKESTK